MELRRALRAAQEQAAYELGSALRALALAERALAYSRPAQLERQQARMLQASMQPERAPHPLGLDLGLVVGRSDLQRATTVLKEELGLFALPEQREGSHEGVGDGDSMEVLSMYERGEALVAARALGEAKLSYRWRDGSEVGSDLPDGECVVIEVNAEDVERAAQVVEDALAGR